ncbi:MAG: ATP-binding protein [Lachnospiraceae bacterium]|jgi:anti-sigma regulatory factor (Ser/Thr protein kinase)|nr:ATP-binding protein [Lachnospiraceae bacterium]
MFELTIDAQADNLDQVLAFVDEHLEEHDCGVKEQMQLDIAVEEIFVNIGYYAYPKGTVGPATIRMDFPEGAGEVSISFIDGGIAFNPLEHEDPDVTASAEERQIGGLGIYMVKKSMDEVGYERTDGKNIFTIRKKF